MVKSLHQPNKQSRAKALPSLPLAPPVSTVYSAIGNSLRERRRKLGMTMAQVAKGSELSIGYISQLERGLSSPSLTALMRIGEVLGMNIDTFLHAPSAGGHHFPKSARSTFRLHKGGMVFDRISGEFSGHTVNALLVEIPPHHLSSPISHTGEELVYVLKGHLRYTLGGRRFQLGAGDAVHLPSATPHCWENPFDALAKVLWVGTAPIFGPDLGEHGHTSDLQSHGSPTGQTVTRGAL